MTTAFDHQRVFNDDQAKAIGDRIGIDWTEISLWEFARGLEVELEHGMELGADTNVTKDDPDLTGRIAHANSRRTTASDRRFIIEPAQHQQLIREPRQGLQCRREDQRPFRRWDPLCHVHPVADIDRTEATHRIGHPVTG